MQLTDTPAINNSQKRQLTPLQLPERLLLGPGPSNAHPDVLRAMSTPPVGHLDPAFLTAMDEIQSLLRYVWQTENPLTIAISGTGSAAMEGAIANSIEPGDVVLIGVAGVWF
jgi:alanine-glyoxylate transaminase / serine-glyoxylate transaminase / serine-pyruvate transaminase